MATTRLEVPEEMQLLNMSNWQSTAMEKQLKVGDPRIKQYDLMEGGNSIYTYETKAPKLLEADLGNLQTDVWEKDNLKADVGWGEYDTLDKMLERQQANPERGDKQGGFWSGVHGVTDKHIEAYISF